MIFYIYVLILIFVNLILIYLIMFLYVNDNYFREIVVKLVVLGSLIGYEICWRGTLFYFLILVIGFYRGLSLGITDII